jgi:hypothetical protein
MAECLSSVTGAGECFGLFLFALAEGVSMQTSLIRTVFTSILVLVFSLALSAQTNPLMPVPTPDLNKSLADLMHVAPLTSQDLSSVHGGKLHWVTFWHRDSAHAGQVAASVRRNLQFAVPNLVHDTQMSGGSISTTFKLYKDLNLVCESLDSLVSGNSHGKNGSTALSNDLAEMNRIKEDLSAYIQQTAASLESKHPELLSASAYPKKIIIDDNVPEKPRSKKRHVN